MKTIHIFYVFVALLAFCQAAPEAIAQVAVGYYDENMVFHYGSPPAQSYSSSGDSGGSYYYEDDWAKAWDDAVKEGTKMADDFQRDWNARQAAQKAERKRKKQEAAKRRKEVPKLFQSGGSKTQKSPNQSGATKAKPTFNLFNLFGLDRVGNDWTPKIVDLKPKAVASQVRSGDNYLRRKEWDKAIRSYQAALRVDPSDGTARRKLAAAKKAKSNASPKKGLFSGLKSTR